MATESGKNAELRALGEERLKVARQAKSREEWEKLWREPKHAYPFSWGDCWKQCVEYRVDDYAAEIGFFIDVLGLSLNAFGPEFTMFTSPDKAFYFAVTPAAGGEGSTPPESIRLQFMIGDIRETAAELEKRGVEFEMPPTPWADGAPMLQAQFRTPHGVAVDLWGMVEPS